ncbi:hypothetical protein JI750_00660 [Flavobacterium sp. GN10]|uniref:Uncharacterized protein n=1 Tax=Flavobacterium tagetis TaxID=2801336 RepID=A0ABS1KB92_9FLAO|nr:hypothetical protein [Flavobacterium tagetis]MBL0735381.1 hypothetical protein [Flavobacterium tagetis]
MIENETELIRIKLLENSIRLFSDFMSVLSDGYNPTMFDIKVSTDKRLTDEDRFVFSSPNNLGTEFFFLNKIQPTRKDITSIRERISENFSWCLNHLATFNNAPDIFRSNYHIDNLNQLVETVKRNIFDLIDLWDIISYEYLIDTNDGSLVRVLFIHSDNKSLILDFGNYIH